MSRSTRRSVSMTAQTYVRAHRVAAYMEIPIARLIAELIATAHDRIGLPDESEENAQRLILAQKAQAPDGPRIATATEPQSDDDEIARVLARHRDRHP